MKGEFQLLLIVVPSVAVGLTALAYYFRRRKSHSHADSSPKLGCNLSHADPKERSSPDPPETNKERRLLESAADRPHGEETADHIQTTGDEAPSNIGGDPTHRPMEPTPSTVGSENATPTGGPPAPGGDIVPSPEPNQDQPAHEEKRSRSPGKRAASEASPREADTVEVRRGEKKRRPAHQPADATEGRDPPAPLSAETVVPDAGGRSSGPTEELAPAEAAGPSKAADVEEVPAADPEPFPAEGGQPNPPDEGRRDGDSEGDATDLGPKNAPQSSGAKPGTKQSPRKYGGLARPTPNSPHGESQAPQQGRTANQASRALPIEVRLRFGRGDSCTTSLLPRRSSHLPEQATAVSPTGEVDLHAMQDEWYQDLVPDDLSSILRNGTMWTHRGEVGPSTWSLSGRDLYILASRTDISGYVSQPCLALGREHVVLCTQPLSSCVEEAIRQAGAEPSAVLDESFGVPPGWLVFRGVVPTAPVPPTEKADLLNALRPLQRIEISLESGIRFGYANWLDGHPPSIRVYGDQGQASEVRIDGQIAERSADGSYRAAGWNSLGAHSVWCAGASKSYSIIPFDASWEFWDAYAFPVTRPGSERLAVCGPIVRAAATESWGPESLTVPDTNPVLLGPQPGQIAMALRASPLCTAPSVASPRFHAVWALPRHPLHCDKQATKILLLDGKAGESTGEVDPTQAGTENADVVRWCGLILDASRKGMGTDPDTRSVRALWLSYKRVARNIWRSRR